VARFPNFARDVRVAHRLKLTTEQFYDLPDGEQQVQIDEYEATQAACPHCGNPREKCSDPAGDWFPQMTICFATMERQAAQRRWENLHPSEGACWHDGRHKRWSRTRTKRTPFHRDDGVTIFATEDDLGLGGDFLKYDDKD
jgi:hypothetical protein